MILELQDVRAIILAGGLGTRLQPVVSDRPKSLAPIGNKTIIDLIIERLVASGIRDIVLSTGHMKDKVREHFVSGKFAERGVKISFSEEDRPLGTGGAIKRAMEAFPCQTTLVMNGDTIFPINYALFLKRHQEARADVSIALTSVDDSARYGTVDIDGMGKIVAFKEKGLDKGRADISAGIYLFEKDALKATDLPESFSIEKDFFERYLHEKNMSGFVFDGYFIDIGLPETYDKAKRDLGKIKDQK